MCWTVLYSGTDNIREYVRLKGCRTVQQKPPEIWNGTKEDSERVTNPTRSVILSKSRFTRIHPRRRHLQLVALRFLFQMFVATLFHNYFLSLNSLLNSDSGCACSHACDIRIQLRNTSPAIQYIHKAQHRKGVWVRENRRNKKDEKNHVEGQKGKSGKLRRRIS